HRLALQVAGILSRPAFRLSFSNWPRTLLCVGAARIEASVCVQSHRLIHGAFGAVKFDAGTAIGDLQADPLPAPCPRCDAVRFVFSRGAHEKQPNRESERTRGGSTGSHCFSSYPPLS